MAGWTAIASGCRAGVVHAHRSGHVAPAARRLNPRATGFVHSPMGTLELAVVGLAGSGLGTVLGAPMIWARRGSTRDTWLMGLWLVALSAIVATISARVMGLVPATPAVNHVINLIGLAAYPLLVLYIHEVSRGGRLPWAAWLWTPALVYAAVVGGRLALGLDTRVPFQWLLPVVLTFTALCVRQVMLAGAAASRGLVSPRHVALFAVALNVAQIVRMLFGDLPLVPAIVPLVSTAGFTSIVGLLVWRVLRHETPAAVTPRYERSRLDQADADVLWARIDRALSSDRLFTDPDLTLARLADAVESTPHQVSEVLNRFAGTTFHELLARRRIDAVKAHLADPSSDRFSIEGIGQSAGFGSRSSLYAAFRRLEGMTPADYRARVRQVD